MADTPYICNAVIEKAEILANDRGILDCWLTLSYGSSGQGFGGWALYLPKSFTHHSVESVAGHFIYRCLEIAGAEKWSEMAGQTIRVRKESDFGRILAIGHIVKDDWFDPTAEFSVKPKAEGKGKHNG